MNKSMESNYDEAVWTMLDPQTAWPTLPEDIDPERGGPEAYFAESIREHIAHARRHLADLENALSRPGWFEVEEDAFDGLREATVGVQVAVTGRAILARATIADGYAPGFHGRISLSWPTAVLPTNSTVLSHMLAKRRRQQAIEIRL